MIQGVIQHTQSRLMVDCISQKLTQSTMALELDDPFRSPVLFGINDERLWLLRRHHITSV